jgi:hypothetical protein
LLDLLYRPRPVRVRGNAQDMNVAGAHLDHEEDVQAAQGDRAINVEEAACQHRRDLRAEELPPGGAAAPGRGRNPQPFKDWPHRGGPDLVAKARDRARLLRDLGAITSTEE